MHGEWRFRVMQPGEMNADPQSEEFFTTEALQDMSEALVRETIQNSLDAGISRPVRIAFNLHGMTQRLAPETSARYLRGLYPHLDQVLPSEAALLSQPMPFLTIEDFGTRGLTGDMRQYVDQAGAKNHFYYFFRNLGRSRKQDRDLGRWGLGKTVLPATSRIRAFIALTHRVDDSQDAVMGQCWLKIHTVDGARCDPFGYFGRFESQLQLPLTDVHSVAELSRDFGLSRDAEPGLSVVIPFPSSDVNRAGLIRAVVNHYLLPLLRGTLEVTVSDERATTRVAVTDLDDVIGEHFSDAIDPKALAFFRNVVGAQMSVAALTIDPPSPVWTEDVVEPATIEKLRVDFAKGEQLALRVRCNVRPKGGSALPTYFDLFLQRDDSLSRGHFHFVRNGLTIPGPGKAAPPGVRGCVLVDDEPLSTFLGDAENPAHTDWHPRIGRLAQRYTGSEPLIRFVKQSLTILTTWLTRPGKQSDRTALADIFYDPSRPGDDSERDDGVEDTSGKRAARDVTLRGLKRTPRRFRVTQTAGGFRIAALPLDPFRPFRLSIRVAYATAEGNPFKRYDPLDFVVGNDIGVSSNSATVLATRANTVQVSFDAPDGEITLSGFDERRDVAIDVAAIQSEDMSESEAFESEAPEAT